MATTYDVSTYLLDKENIRDTVLRMMYGFDDRDSLTLVDLIYTPEVSIHYDPLLIDFDKKVTSQEWAARLEHLHDRFDTTQNILQNLLIELPQPGNMGKTTQRPEVCKARAYAHGWFYKRDGDGRPTVMARRQRGRYELELRRLPEKEEKGENPWRISALRVKLDWQDRGDHLLSTQGSRLAESACQP